MDLHKNSSTFAVKDRDGNLVDSTKVPTEPSAIKGYLRKFPAATLVMEPVSQWYLAHPMKVKAIAEARIKTDKIDAGVLCDLLRTNFLPEAYFSRPEVRCWKEMVRYRASLINLRTQLKNKIHAILFKNAIRHPFANLFSVKGRKWLESLELKEAFAFPLERYVSLLDMLDAVIDEADQKIKRTVSEDAGALLLTSIPGISYVSGLTIIGEIGNIHRFRSAKKLMGYAGLAPSTYSSGDSIRHGRITKQGSKWLRYTMIEAAHRQPFARNSAFGSYYNHIKGRKDSKTAAVATAEAACRGLEDPHGQPSVRGHSSTKGSPGCSPMFYRHPVTGRTLPVIVRPGVSQSRMCSGHVSVNETVVSFPSRPGHCGGMLHYH